MSDYAGLIEDRIRRAAVFSAMTGVATGVGLGLSAVGSIHAFTAGTAMLGFAILALHNLEKGLIGLRAALRARAEQEKK